MKKTSAISKIESSGFTLIEVMVAMVIFAIGLLGLAGLQATALNSNHASYTRTQATLLAYDMADRIRANPVPGEYAGVANPLLDGVTNPLFDFANPPAGDPAACVAPLTCDSTAMKDADIATWGSRLAALLPKGNGSIAWIAATSTYTITVHWDEDRTGVEGVVCSNNTAVDLSCYTTSVAL